MKKISYNKYRELASGLEGLRSHSMKNILILSKKGIDYFQVKTLNNGDTLYYYNPDAFESVNEVHSAILNSFKFWGKTEGDL